MVAVTSLGVCRVSAFLEPGTMSKSKPGPYSVALRCWWLCQCCWCFGPVHWFFLKESYHLVYILLHSNILFWRRVLWKNKIWGPSRTHSLLQIQPLWAIFYSSASVQPFMSHNGPLGKASTAGVNSSTSLHRSPPATRTLPLISLHLSLEGVIHLWASSAFLTGTLSSSAVTSYCRFWELVCTMTYAANIPYEPKHHTGSYYLHCLEFCFRF